MAGFVIQIGEAFVGEGPEAAHLNTVLGERAGPVGTGWVTALATPRQGHAAFLAVVRPGIACKPPTLFVNKAALESESHAQLTWGAAQAGVASGVMRAVEDDVIERAIIDDLVLVAAVWVAPQAADADLVFDNNLRATRLALEAGAKGFPDLDKALAAGIDPFNPFFRPRS
ncbi:MAG: formaldehyde-activating enzyme [Acidimicrobiales bacterium]